MVGSRQRILLQKRQDFQSKINARNSRPGGRSPTRDGQFSRSTTARCEASEKARHNGFKHSTTARCGGSEETGKAFKHFITARCEGRGKTGKARNKGFKLSTTARCEEKEEMRRKTWASGLPGFPTLAAQISTLAAQVSTLTAQGWEMVAGWKHLTTSSQEKKKDFPE